nr:hypothetical protein [Tanacetum cinerariifolium]
KGEDNQVYGILIPDVMLNNDIKKSKACHTYLAIPMGIVVPKKARKGMKTPATPNKKGLIITADNIIPDPEEALKLGKLISKTKSEEDAAKSEKADEKTANEEELHSDKEVHTDEEELHADNKAHDDEYVHDDEKHDDTDEEMHDDENADELKDDQEMANLEKQNYHHLPPVFLCYLNMVSVPAKEPADTEINSLLDVQIQQETPIVQSAPLLDVLVYVNPKQTTPTPLPTPPTLVGSLSKLELKNILMDKMQKSYSYLDHDKYHDLYDALLNSISLDEAIARGDVDPTKFLKRRRHDDEDQEPPPDSEKEKTKQRRKDVEPSKKSSTSKESSKSKTQSKPLSIDKPVNAEEPIHEAEIDMEERILNDVVYAENDPLTFDKLMATPIDFSKFTMNRIKLDKITKADLVGPIYKLLNGTCKRRIELEYNMDQCYNALTDQLDWTNPKGDRCLYELSKPLPLQGSPVKVAYDKDDALGTSHLRPKCQLFCRSQINRFSKHDVYSTMKILSVISVKVDKQFGYGYLQEIVARKANRKLYTFKEGDFTKLHLNDIEEMLLLHVHNKLFNLDGDDIIELVVALLMFTKRIVIQKRVEDVQLSVESYQKKLNITPP